MLWGETGKISSLPLQRGGLGWGNLRNNGDSITCVYTIALQGGIKRGNFGDGNETQEIINHVSK